jgi:hypothetical protein
MKEGSRIIMHRLRVAEAGQGMAGRTKTKTGKAAQTQTDW